MKFTYLGTGAAEGVPAMFCSCDTWSRGAGVAEKANFTPVRSF